METYAGDGIPNNGYGEFRLSEHQSGEYQSREYQPGEYQRRYYSEHPQRSPSLDPLDITRLAESTVLGAILLYLIVKVLVPTITEDRAKALKILERLTASIDKLSDRFERIEDRLERLENTLDRDIKNH